MTFEEKVRNFFKKHKPGLAYLAPKIAKKFYHDQSAVLEHLHNRYVKGAPSTYDPNKVVPKPSQSYVELGKPEEATDEVAAEEPVAEESATEATPEASNDEISLDKADETAEEATDEAPAEVEATDEENKN